VGIEEEPRSTVSDGLATERTAAVAIIQLIR
jgi:hypothetical protein